jgi:hypothetical protein
MIFGIDFNADNMIIRPGLSGSTFRVPGVRALKDAS